MSSQRPGNEGIQIGMIFRENTSGECDVSYCYFQVVGLRGRTLVELRRLRTEEYVDERCRNSQWTWHVWRRPLPGEFAEDSRVFTVRALGADERDGTRCLQGRGENSRCYYHETREGEESFLAGYAGGYARARLKKEGKLPAWADVP